MIKLGWHCNSQHYRITDISKWFTNIHSLEQLPTTWNYQQIITPIVKKKGFTSFFSEREDSWKSRSLTGGVKLLLCSLVPVFSAGLLNPFFGCVNRIDLLKEYVLIIKLSYPVERRRSINMININNNSKILKDFNHKIFWNVSSLQRNTSFW